jgi:hypothetical protein
MGSTTASSHRVTPKANGMVERFNRRVNEVIARTHFASPAQLRETVSHDINVARPM